MASDLRFYLHGPTLNNKFLHLHSDIAAKPTPILFYCNKKDLPAAIDAAEISKILDLPRIADRPLQIVASNAVKGEGVAEGMRWLADRVNVK